MVPTGSALVATSTCGPSTGTLLPATFAPATGADAPMIMLRAMNAVTAATISAPTSKMIFFPSMTLLAFL